MAYRDTQFETSSVYSGEQSFEYTNPRFIYPTRVVRMVENAVGQRGPGGVVPITVPLKSGFMRNVNTGYASSGVNMPRTKLQFQFNPQEIQQEVVARQDMYLSVLQDPAQLSQPVAGNANFRFDLLFDRTMEVKNGGGKTGGVRVDDPPGVSPGDGGPGDAADIGVLADLQVMYAIIGQGMNSLTVSEQSARIKDITKREYERAVSAQDPFFNKLNAFNQAKITTDDKVIYEKKDFEELYNKAFKDYSNVNIGNAAFLVPMPVRIVFSSLYMVDGYVVKSSVLFTKFSTKLVPIQCRVMLEVNAVYLGFARDTTFLTQQIDKNVSSERQAKVLTQTEVNNFIKEYATKYLATLNVNFSGDPTKANPFIVPSFAVGDFGGIYSNPTAAGFASKGEWWVPPDDDNPSISVAFMASSDKSNSKVKDFYKSGGSVSIDQYVKVEVYGPYDSKTAAESDKKLTANKVGIYTQNKLCNSESQWDSGSWSFTNSNFNAANVSNGAITPINVITPEEYNELLRLGQRPISALNNAYKDKWFTFVVKATVNIGGAGDANATGNSSGGRTAEQTFYAKGDTNLSSKTISLNFDWSKANPTTGATYSGSYTTNNTSDYGFLSGSFR